MTRVGGLSSDYLTRVGGPSSAYLNRVGGVEGGQNKMSFCLFLSCYAYAGFFDDWRTQIIFHLTRFGLRATFLFKSIRIILVPNEASRPQQSNPAVSINANTQIFKFVFHLHPKTNLKIGQCICNLAGLKEF